MIQLECVGSGSIKTESFETVSNFEKVKAENQATTFRTTSCAKHGHVCLGYSTQKCGWV